MRLHPAHDVLRAHHASLTYHLATTAKQDQGRDAADAVLGTDPGRGVGVDLGETYARFGEGGGQSLADEIGVPLLGKVPLEPSVAAGGDAGVPVSLDGTGIAADTFRSIAKQIIDEVAPPTNMAGCSARLIGLVNAALDAKDAAKDAAASA